MRLFHPSNKEFDIIKVKYFGENFYTKNDVKASSIKRSFWYLKYPIPEKRFVDCKYIYITEISDKKIYDLVKDKLYLNNGLNNLEDIIEYLKTFYLGIKYHVANYDIVAIFQDIKPEVMIGR